METPPIDGVNSSQDSGPLTSMNTRACERSGSEPVSDNSIRLVKEPKSSRDLRSSAPGGRSGHRTARMLSHDLWAALR